MLLSLCLAVFNMLTVLRWNPAVVIHDVVCLPVCLMIVLCAVFVCCSQLSSVWLSVPVQSIASKTYHWNDQLFVEWDVKLFPLTLSVIVCRIQFYIWWVFSVLYGLNALDLLRSKRLAWGLWCASLNCNEQETRVGYTTWEL